MNTVKGIVLLLVTSAHHLVSGFNVDLETATIIRSPAGSGSMFGYTVAQHEDSGEKW